MNYKLENSLELSKLARRYLIESLKISGQWKNPEIKNKFLFSHLEYSHYLVKECRKLSGHFILEKMNDDEWSANFHCGNGVGEGKSSWDAIYRAIIGIGEYYIENFKR